MFKSSVRRRSSPLWSRSPLSRLSAAARCSASPFACSTISMSALSPSPSQSLHRPCLRLRLHFRDSAASPPHFLGSPRSRRASVSALAALFASATSSPTSRASPRLRLLRLASPCLRLRCASPHRASACVVPRLALLLASPRHRYSPHRASACVVPRLALLLASPRHRSDPTCRLMATPIQSRVIIHEDADGSTPDSGYLAAKQKFEGEAKERDVLIRSLATNMHKLFTVRKPFDHVNIQKVFDFVPSEGKSMMTCEKVDVNLSTWMKQRLPQKPLSGLRNSSPKTLDSDAMVRWFMRQSTLALDYLHKRGYYYVPLSCEDLYLSFDHRYQPTDVEYYVLKLTLPQFENQLMENPDVKLHGIGTEAIVWQGLASVLNSWLSYLKPKRFVDFSMLELTLRECTYFNEKRLDGQYCMWYDIKKIQFVNLMAPLPARGSLAEDMFHDYFAAQHWTLTFRDAIFAVRKFLLGKDQKPKDYTDTLEDFVDFMAKSFRHYLEYPSEVRVHLGNNEIEVLQNFEGFYPTLFYELTSVAYRVNTLSGFANDTY